MTVERKRLPAVNTQRCTGCGRCVAACPFRLFTLEVCGYRKHAQLRNQETCTSCGKCLGACPVGALGWQDEEQEVRSVEGEKGTGTYGASPRSRILPG